MNESWHDPNSESNGRITAPREDTQPGVLRVFSSRDETRRYYDRIAPIYDLVADASEASAREAGLALLSVKPGEKVLEVGCGTGHCAVDLAALVGPRGKVFGIDIATAMVTLAREKATRAGVGSRVAIICGDGEHLPFVSGSMDALFMSFTLELFDTPHLPSFLAECQRVLRQSGRIGVVGMSKEGGHGLVFDLYEWTHEHFPRFLDCRPIYVARALKEAGFAVTAMQHRKMWVPVEVVVACKT